jgi:hypothetical protein
LVKKYDESIFSRLFSYSSHRKGLFAVGVVACICNGLVFPVFSIFLARMLAILLDFEDNPVQARKDANLYALLYFIIGIGSFVFSVIQ